MKQNYRLLHFFLGGCLFTKWGCSTEEFKNHSCRPTSQWVCSSRWVERLSCLMKRTMIGPDKSGRNKKRFQNKEVNFVKIFQKCKQPEGWIIFPNTEIQNYTQAIKQRLPPSCGYRRKCVFPSQILSLKSPDSSFLNSFSHHPLFDVVWLEVYLFM